MNDYFTAYRNRMETVDRKLKELAEELKSQGYIVKGSKRGLMTFIVITTADDKQEVSVEFGEVPYRWTIYRPIKPSRERGNSVTVKEYGIGIRNSMEEAMEFPFTWEDLVASMSIIDWKVQENRHFYLQEI